MSGNETKQHHNSVEISGYILTELAMYPYFMQCHTENILRNSRFVYHRLYELEEIITPTLLRMCCQSS